MAESASPLLSIVVPFRNELATLQALNHDSFAPLSNVEWIFVDGGSSDGSAAVLQQNCLAGAPVDAMTVISSPPGRATQMNAGAQCARGDYLLFLHIDTSLPASMEQWLEQLAQRKPVWGFFPLRLDGSEGAFRIIERMISWRARLDHLATGDQAQFVARSVFEELGGFPDLAIMEDRELSRVLRRRAKPWIYNEAVISSSRRWQQHGIWRTVLLMWVMKWRWRLGSSPQDLAQCYRENRLW